MSKLKDTSIIITAIFISAFLIRLSINIIFQGIDSGPDPEMGPDHIEYNLLAENFIKGYGFVIHPGDNPNTSRPPGVSFLLIPLYAIFGIKYWIVRIFFSLIGALTCILLYRFSRKCGLDLKVSLVSSILLCFLPSHIFYSSHFFSEIPFCFFTILTLNFIADYNRTHWIKYGVLAGAAAAFSSLIRPNALLFFPLSMLLFWAHEKSFFKMFRYFIIPVIAFLCCLMPWAIRNYTVLNDFCLISTHGGVTFLGAHNDSTFFHTNVMGEWVPVSELAEWKELKTHLNKPVYADKLIYKKGYENIVKHIDLLPKLELMKLYRLFIPITDTPNLIVKYTFAISWILLLPFYLTGFAVTIKRKEFITVHALFFMILWTSLYFYGCERFLSSIAPVIVLYSTIGIKVIYRKMIKPV